MHRLIFSIFAISLATNYSLAEKALDTKSAQLIEKDGITNTNEEKVKQAIDKLIPIIKDGLEKTNIPGGYLVVTQKNKIICVVSFGNTTIASNNPKPIDNNTVFPVSSISKNITAFLVGALVDDGKIKWEDKVRKYDKDFFLHSEELSAELTIQDLISHCSGFKHFSADSLWSGQYPCNKIVDSFKYLNQKPGVFRKYYGYQNVIFGLVGNILEKATGEKYEDLVQKYLFDKMDMNDSSAIDLKYETSKIGHMKYLTSRFKHDMNKNGFFSTTWNFIKSIFTFKSKNISLSHSRYMDNIYQVDPNGYFHVFPATAGLAFSANDFAKFVQMVLNGGVYNNKTIVTRETFKKITSKITEINNIKDDDLTFKKERFPRKDMSYGIGTFITQYGDNGKNTRKVIFHMGGACGAASFYIVSPEDDIGVGCVVNLGGVSHTLFAEYMCNNFLDLYFGFKGIDWVQAELDRKNTMDQKKKLFENDVKKVLSPMRHINEYVGTYTSDIYGDINVTLNKDNKLFLSNGIKSTELQHINGNIFKFPSKNMLNSYFDSDEYVAFRNDQFNNIDSFYISCFSEGNTIFKRKEEKNNDASTKQK